MVGIGCCFSSSFYFRKKKESKFVYLITDKRIILETRFAYCTILYQDVLAINRKDKWTKRYDIIINLNKPIIDNPFYRNAGDFAQFEQNVFYIKDVLEDDDLFEKVKYLIDRPKLKE